MRKSARKKIDDFFYICQKEIDNLSPEKVIEKQSRYFDDEKIQYFSLKLKKFFSRNPEFSKRINGDAEHIPDYINARNCAPANEKEDDIMREATDVVTLNKTAVRFCDSILRHSYDILDSRERFICEQLAKGRTIKSVSGELGISNERVRQIFEKCIRKISLAFEEYMEKGEAIRDENEALKHRNQLLENELLSSTSLSKVDKMLNQEQVLSVKARRLLCSPLENLCIPARAINILHSMGITIFNEIPLLTVEELYRARNCGRKTVVDIQAYLSRYNLSLDLTYDEIISRLSMLSDDAIGKWSRVL